MNQWNRRVGTMLLALLVTAGIQAETVKERNVRNDIDTAVAALQAAERAGAPLYAKALYDDAASRLHFAQANFDNKKSDMRNAANLRAIEAYFAARAAEAKANWVSGGNEARNLRTDITTFGGTTPDLPLGTESDTPIDRGSTTTDRIHVAEAAIARAEAVGGNSVAKGDLDDAKGRLETARKIEKARNNDDTADNMAYTAEMIARRVEYRTRAANVQSVLPALRLQRTQLAQRASEIQAAQEAQRRANAEQQAAAMQQQLLQAEADKKAQAAELNAMRTQIAQHQADMQAQLDRDREARLAAEKRLDLLSSQYEAALGTATTNSDVDALRRQLEDQRIALNVAQQQEKTTESSMRAEIDRLSQALADERARGASSADVVASREAELNRQRAELDRLARERQAAEQARAESERAHAQAIAAAQQRLTQAESEIASLRAQVANEQARNAATTAELQSTKMQQELSKIAQTRSESRGLVVTLPGIFFDSGKSQLKPGAKSALKRIAAQLGDDQQLRITIEGHTDSVGSTEMNEQLSEARATAVRNELAADGIAASRLTVVGRGEAEPVASNKTAAGRQQNRRVELVIRPEQTAAR